MHTTLPWPVSPEFQDALALATQRHLAQPATAPSSPYDLPPSPHLSSSKSSSSITRSSSIRMKTRVAVRERPHRFQVIPLREAKKNRENNMQSDTVKPTATWTRAITVMRPSGVGLGLNVQVQSPSAPGTPERGRERTPRQGDLLKDVAASPPRKGTLRGLQGLSPTRPSESPDRKENRIPRSRYYSKSPLKRSRRLREYTLPAYPTEPLNFAAGDQSATILTMPSISAQDLTQTTQENIAITTAATSFENLQQPDTLSLQGDTTITVEGLATLKDAQPRTKDAKNPSFVSRHFKSPSLGAIHHLLSASSSSSNVHRGASRVRCRKRTNTLSAAHESTKRYGVYTPGRLDLSPVVSEVDARPASTYSLGALLSAYSCESLPSMYSQDSFMDHVGTRPLRVKVRRSPQGQRSGHPHPIVVQLLRKVDEAIGEWMAI